MINRGFFNKKIGKTKIEECSNVIRNSSYGITLIALVITIIILLILARN